MKKALVILASVFLLVCMCAGTFSGAERAVTDPSQVYSVQTAPSEDSDISLWFEHSFKKVMTSDTTHSGMDTYSVYMGKNEIENAQFVLYSDVTKSRIRATVSDFTDSKGNTLSASVYYQMYITLSGLDTLGFQGATAGNTFIRNGEQPDPVVPMSKAGLIQLNAGKSQAFYIRVESTEDSEPGWYSAQLDIKNAKGEIIKTATVYAYVWDFTLSDESPLQTSIYLANKGDQYGTYKDYYDYLLENRINAMDLPGGLTSQNPYLTDPRVNSIRVSSEGGGYVNSYMDTATAYYTYYTGIYNDLSSMKEWEHIKDKFYFYTVDEPTSDEHQQMIFDYFASLGIKREKGRTVDDVINNAALLDKYWPDAVKIVPYHENHPYPYNVYNTQTIARLDPARRYDGLQAMIDTNSVNKLCPQFYAFTPSYELNKVGYAGTYEGSKIRNLSGSVSGSIRALEGYFNWEGTFGEFKDRIISANMVNNSKGPAINDLWAYNAGMSGSYSYCNHLIENSGLQTKMLFWQFYQSDVTGYLYYGANQWTEYLIDHNGDGVGEVTVDKTVTGTKTGNWHTNEYRYTDASGKGYAIFGNGTLFYQATQGGFTNGLKYIGSIRVDHIRDGIDEYQMLTMLEELRGDKAADDIVALVCKNNVNYLSMPAFNRSAYDKSMSDYDVMAAVRIMLGNELEKAIDSKCEHKYDGGKVTKAATCLALGEKTYTCTLCGAGKIEYIPALHAEGECFSIATIKKTSCTSDGEYKYTCTVCGYSKYVAEKSYHSDPEHYVYKMKNDMTSVHGISCDKCGEELRTEKHSNLAEYTSTCTDAGVHNDKCKYCGYFVKIGDVESKGHYYVDGVCVNCGDGAIDEPDVTVVPGDVDGDGEVTMLDLFALKLFIKQKDVPTDAEVAAGDIDGDGELTMVDSFELKYRISKGFWRE